MGNTRCVVVTGAESGIGAACAAAFGAAGDDVAVFYYRDEGKAQATADAVTAAGGRAQPVQCAVVDEPPVEAAFATVGAGIGPSAGVVHFAGANIDGVPLRQWTDDSTHATVATERKKAQ